MLTRLLALLLFGASIMVAAAAETLSRDEKQQLTAQVEKIFEAKCADCHGSHLPKPKGKFGYVLDLARVAKNGEFVTPGNPKTSELYRLVVTNEMPGEDADVPALTPEELKVVEKWILVGAPGELPPSYVPKEVATSLEKGATVLPSKPFLSRLLSWLGRFHPASTHFPVALLLVAVFAEGIAWWIRRAEWLLLVRFLVILGALSAIPTATLGWLADYPVVHGSTISQVYNFHRILGTATAVWGLVCAWLICSSECEEGSLARKKFRGALLLGALLVSITGLLGGFLSTSDIYHYAFPK